MSLQTLSDLKLQLSVSGSTDDALLEELQLAADEAIRQHCQRDFTGGDFTEYHRSGSRTLFVRNFPISAITTIQVDPRREFGPETTLDPTQYVLLPDAGLIESVAGSFLREAIPNAIKVVYSTPASVPADVLRAEAELVSHWYRFSKTAAANGQQNLLTRTDGTVVTEYPWGQSGGFRLPNGVLQLLKPYRVPSLG